MSESPSFFHSVLAQHIQGRKAPAIVKRLGQQIIYGSSKARASVPPIAKNVPIATTSDD